jgi:hypothetical protein
MNKLVFLILILILAIGLPLLFHITESFKKKRKDGFSNYNLEESVGIYPTAQSNVLLQDTYPITGRNGISNNNSSDIWWHFPTFHLGSYKQITNNIRYPNNPDEGTCEPASMCGALYKEKQLMTNYVEPLPPINPDCGTRIGYFTTDENLLPFRTDVPNILY